MFNLDHAIDTWCAKLSDRYQASVEDIDELKDHLHTAVESRLESGQSQEEAFDHVIAEFGDLKELGEQFGRKNNLRQWLSRYGTCTTNTSQRKSRAGTPITIALMFAASMLFAAWVIKDKSVYMPISIMLIALWFTVDAFFGGNSAINEMRCLKRWVQRKIGA